MAADFTPIFTPYSGQGSFKFWAQKILPLVYDDSLSYYELLCKVVDSLNSVINDMKTVEDNTQALLDAYNQLQGYVNTYFDNLDVQEEINNKLDEMSEPGGVLETYVSDFLLDYITPEMIATATTQEKVNLAVEGQIDDAVAGQIGTAVAPAVGNWLTENVDPVGSAVIVDSSLTIPNAAANAKVTGDKFDDSYRVLTNTEINSLEHLTDMPVNKYMWVDNVKMAALLDDTDHPFPYDIATTTTYYFVQMMKQSNFDTKRVEIFRLTGVDWFVGWTAREHDWFEWSNLSFSDLNTRITTLENHDLPIYTLAANDDLNEKTERGIYYTNSYLIARTIKNSPVTNIHTYAPNGAFIVKVEKYGNYSLQTVIFGRDTNRICMRKYNNSTEKWYDYVVISDSSNYDYNIDKENFEKYSENENSIYPLKTKGVNIRKAYIVDENDVDDSDIIQKYQTYITTNTSKGPSNGVTCNWSNVNNTATFNGRCTGSFFITLISRSDSIPIFKPGNMYKITVNNDMVEAAIVYYTNSDTNPDYSTLTYLKNNEIFTVRKDKPRGCAIRLYAVVGTTYENTPVKVEIFEEPCNFAKQEGPYLGFSDIIKAPKYIICEPDTNVNMIEFYNKINGEYVIRHDVLETLDTVNYMDTNYLMENVIKARSEADAINNRVIEVPDDAYISIATLSVNTGYIYGWNGKHSGCDIGGFAFTFKPSLSARVSYSDGVMGFRVPGDAKHIWCNKAIIKDLYGLSATGTFTTIFENSYHQECPVGGEYAYYCGNILLDAEVNVNNNNVASYYQALGSININNYLSSDSFVDSASASIARSLEVISMADKLANTRWTCKAQKKMYGGSRYYLENMNYIGIPYTAMFVKATQVGWHISRHTLVNAMNDVNSYFYAGGGRHGDGPGYGLVCTSFAQLTAYFPWLVCVEQLETDPQLYKYIDYNPDVGQIMSFEHHCLIFGDKKVNKNYKQFTNYECTSIDKNANLTNVNIKYNIPCTFFTGKLGFVNQKDYYHGEYPINPRDEQGFYDIDDVTITNGSARPYLGDWCVYTSEDNVRINICDSNANMLYVQKCNYSDGVFTPTQDEPIAISIGGSEYININKANLTNGGIYGVYTDVNSTKEYFEYRVVTPFTYSYNDGVLSFSNNSDWWYACFDGNYTPNTYYQSLPRISSGDYSSYKGVISPCDNDHVNTPCVAFYKGTLGAYVCPVTRA